MQRAILAVSATFFVGPSVWAQSMNIDFGQPADAPSATYAAAGLPGFWNSIPAINGSTTTNLRKLDGAPTPVQLVQVGGTQTLTVNDPATAGDDGKLMDDYLVTFNPNLESCLFIRFLEIARYKVIIYARMPNESRVMSYTSTDEEVGYPHYDVGGAWPGGHAEFITYSSHIAVPDNTLTRIRAHSGISPGADAGMGAALNGIQLIKIKPGDVNLDDQVNVLDLLAVVGAWGPCPAMSGACEPDIAPYPAGNGEVNVLDLLEVISNWG